MTSNSINTKVANVPDSASEASAQRSTIPTVGDIVECEVVEILKGINQDVPPEALLSFGSRRLGIIRSRDFTGSEAEQLNQMRDLRPGFKFHARIKQVELASIPTRLNVLSAGMIVTARIVGPCKTGIKLVLKSGIEAVLAIENIGDTADKLLKKGKDLRVRVLDVKNHTLVVTRDGLGKSNLRAKQECMRTVRRARLNMQGESGKQSKK
jgi:hypothetical protein